MCFSICVKDYFQVSFNLKKRIVHGQNYSKYRDGDDLSGTWERQRKKNCIVQMWLHTEMRESESF